MLSTEDHFFIVVEKGNDIKSTFITADLADVIYCASYYQLSRKDRVFVVDMNEHIHWTAHCEM